MLSGFGTETLALIEHHRKTFQLNGLLWRSVEAWVRVTESNPMKTGKPKKPSNPSGSVLGPRSTWVCPEASLLITSRPWNGWAWWSLGFSYSFCWCLDPGQEETALAPFSWGPNLGPVHQATALSGGSPGILVLPYKENSLWVWEKEPGQRWHWPFFLSATHRAGHSLSNWDGRRPRSQMSKYTLYILNLLKVRSQAPEELPEDGKGWYGPECGKSPTQRQLEGGAAHC